MSLSDELGRWFEYGRTLGRGDGRLTAGQVQTVLTVVTLGLVILVGILVFSEVETSLPSASANTGLSNAQSNATTDFSNAMELAPVIMVVLIASVVIGIVSRFRQ